QMLGDIYYNPGAAEEQPRWSRRTPLARRRRTRRRSRLSSIIRWILPQIRRVRSPFLIGVVLNEVKRRKPNLPKTIAPQLSNYLL
ncbi:MAG: hypothetical protein VKL39_12855, partial [Leptolyngbyaceae bacterium]|nr:hypothetical protein [Leptolyngbyaceae bacterium]